MHAASGGGGGAEKEISIGALMAGGPSSAREISLGFWGFGEWRRWWRRGRGYFERILGFPPLIGEVVFFFEWIDRRSRTRNAMGWAVNWACGWALGSLF